MMQTLIRRRSDFVAQRIADRLEAKREGIYLDLATNPHLLARAITLN